MTYRADFLECVPGQLLLKGGSEKAACPTSSHAYSLLYPLSTTYNDCRADFWACVPGKLPLKGGSEKGACPNALHAYSLLADSTVVVFLIPWQAYQQVDNMCVVVCCSVVECDAAWLGVLQCAVLLVDRRCWSLVFPGKRTIR